MADPDAAAVRAPLRRRLAMPAATLAAVSLAAATVWFADPTTPGGVLPPCPTNHFLHVNCPGCGGLRAVYALLHGDAGAALAYNAFAVAVLALGAVAFAGYTLGRWRGRPVRSPVRPRYVWITLGVLAAVWFVVRNIPVEPFVSLKV